jgi:hypothetical protein
MKQRSGYVYHDKITNTWVARTTLTDETGKRRNIKRNASNKSDAKRILRTLLRRIDDEGSRSIDTERLTFNTLADHYDLHYLKPAEFVDGRKISGLRLETLQQNSPPLHQPATILREKTEFEKEILFNRKCAN